MLLDILLLAGSLEKAIGNSVHVTFGTYGGEDEKTFPFGLKVKAEWLVGKELIRLEQMIPATDLDRARDQKGLEEFLLKAFVRKAREGYMVKLDEIRSKIEQEIRNAGTLR
jgi:hypothetical protein